MYQANQAYAQVASVLPWLSKIGVPVLFGLLMALAVGSVIVGGINRIGEVAGHDGVMVGYGDFEHDGIRQNSDLGVFEEDVFGAHFVELGAINHAGFRDDEAEDFAGHEEFGDLGARRRVFCGEDGCAAVDVCAEEENQPAGEQHDERHENRA